MNPGGTQTWQRMFARVASPFRHAVSLLRDVAAQADLSIDDQARWNEAIGALLIRVIRADGHQTPEEVAQIETLFTLQFGKREAQRVKQVVEHGPPRPIRELCETLNGLSAQDRAEMIRAMLEMATADDNLSAEEVEVIEQAAKGFGFDGECVARFRQELAVEREKRAAIVKSGAGIAVALAVIGVFVFAATFLKSVIFGLILAYLFWPLQRFYQHRFFPHPWIQQAQRILGWFTRPFHAAAERLKKVFALGHGSQPDPNDNGRKVAQACHATMVTVLGLGVLATGLFLWTSSKYVASVGQFVVDSTTPRRESAPAPSSTKPTQPAPAKSASPAPNAPAPNESPSKESTSSSSASQPGAAASAAERGGDSDEASGAGIESDAASVDAERGSTSGAAASGDDGDRGGEVAAADVAEAPEESGEREITLASDTEPEPRLIGEGVPWLERYRPYVARSTLLRTAAEVVESYLTDPDKKKELAIRVFQNLQPILIRAGGLAAMLGSLLLDLLMTLFFFSFFLQRIAMGQSREGGLRRPTGQYLVEAIFNSGWLPNASPAAMREGQMIIDEIILMLKTWLRGYLWIIAIDTVLYTAIFMALGIPYSPVLGLLAGLTILLPFIGPIVSCSLTLIVTFALYSQSVTLMVIIIVVYLVIHGIVEQLILYPALVGEALGLNALETIIIVLLGGLVSGLAGAVFAVPVAAILKYLIPKVYQALWPNRLAEA